MKVEQLSIADAAWHDVVLNFDIKPSIFLLFISPTFKGKEELTKKLKSLHPNATIMGCSTAGEISNVSVSDGTVSLTAIELEKVNHKLEMVNVETMGQSFVAGAILASKLNSDDLKHVLVLSDGLNVNGADLVTGLKSILPKTSINGGLAGDSGNFTETFILANDVISDRVIVGIGFYGEELQVGYSSKGGWDSFGIDRLVTKSDKNVLYELDGLPALELYKSFLGDNASNLPKSGLLFPLSMRVNDRDIPVVRTILGVDEDTQSLTFAGNIPEGAYMRLMKANIDRLIDGAEDSAKDAFNITKNKTELAILISWVGRRFVLKQLVEEEVEAVEDIIGNNPKITGFYSYGEIAPFGVFSPCELHNQTMTVTTLSEC